ncbi:MAG TPA: NAD-dependent epimerase/dehydratase family protein [Thermoplasmata archaeon]|nr:NAD-dependent epimerase/dehydratase family protein [Thermoplasmata archaeon]
MKVAVTGAGGFIGSHLVDRLLARGDAVVALDIGRKLPVHLQEASGRPGFVYRRCDVTRPSSVRKAFAERPDAVVHAAATVGVESYLRTPMETVESSVIGTRTVLRAAMRPAVRFVYLSSSEVFGRNPSIPWSETSDRVLGDPSLHRWSYSSSKGLCEHLVNAAHAEYGVPTAIARPFNIYGARQRPAFVVPTTIQRVLNGIPPVIYGDGTQTRCFTYIGDLVDGLLRCLDLEAAVGETFNLGNPRERTISETMRLILEACGASLEPTHEDPRATFGAGFDEIPRRVPDVAKAARVLGWAPSTELPDGLAATVAWARAHPEWVRMRRRRAKAPATPSS